MHRMTRSLGALWLALWLPLAVVAKEPAPAEPGLTQAAPAAAGAQAGEERKTRAFTGVIREVTASHILVQQVGHGRKLKSNPILRVPGDAETPVSGQGKDRWAKLRRGDVVAVAFRPGPPPETLKVLVLPATAMPQVIKAVGKTPRKGKREFTGWIKHKDGSLLVVRSPDAAPPGKRKGQIKEFVRTDATTVEVLRSSWDEIRKGDRVTIEFAKGDPRPIKRIQVVSRGGEKPLPPGLAKRLFDPRYDASLEDVGGPAAETASP